MWLKNGFFGFALCLLGWISDPALVFGDESADTPAVLAVPVDVCGDGDPRCSKRMTDFLVTRNPVLPVRIEGGVRFSWSEGALVGQTPVLKTRAGIRLSDQLLHLRGASGDLRVLPFEWVAIPDSEQFRLRLALADSEISYICKYKQGEDVLPPFVSLFDQGKCRPDAIFGVSAKALEFQVDTFSTHRVALRFLEAQGVANLLANGMSESSIRRNLILGIGASWDMVVPNRYADASVGGHFPRGVVGISGVWISDDTHWEIRGSAQYRPNLTDIRDAGSELRAQLLRRFMLGYDFMGEVGGVAQYSHWSIPGRSMGTYASGQDPHTMFLGALFGLYYNPAYR